MKKLILVLAMSLVAIAGVQAQKMYIGGGFTVGAIGADDVFFFQLAPEVGCQMTDQWSVGGEIGYTHMDGFDRFQFAPYARYAFYKNGILGLFVDGTIGVGVGDGDTGVRLGLRPGLTLDVTNRISLITKVGFLGYSDSYDSVDVKGVTFSTDNVSIGFLCRF